jgi:hypothetical protein
MKTLIATLAFLAASAATAQTTTPAKAEEKTAPASTGRTRAEVIAEVLEARKNGTLIENEIDMDVAQTKKHIAK